MSTYYTFSNPHQSMPGLIVTQHGYQDVATNPYYSYAPPSAPALMAQTPQPPMSQHPML